MNLRIALFFLALSCSLSLPARAAAARPNIVLIMADDMGFSDIGCYGGEIRTPHIDRLATEGVRFSQFYNNAKCTTTRASLLSGMYPRKNGNAIPRDLPTIAESMRAAPTPPSVRRGARRRTRRFAATRAGRTRAGSARRSSSAGPAR